MKRTSLFILATLLCLAGFSQNTLRSGKDFYVSVKDMASGTAYVAKGNTFLIPATAMRDSLQLIFVDSNFSIYSLNYSFIRTGTFDISNPRSIQGAWLYSSVLVPYYSPELRDHPDLQNHTTDDWIFRKGDRLFFDDVRVMKANKFLNFGTFTISVTD